MATTTPNFGWDIPQSTDLVKDGATAIAALGNDIDTSMVDLKGGTTGQVLSKASNTDMDFTWVAQDDSNAIQNAIVDAKGDLISATAADTPARLAVGSNGQSLYADSSTSTGLRWQDDTSVGRNKILNSDYGIWQRGTSFSNPSNGAYTADRWFVELDGSGFTRTISQQTFTPGTAPVAGYEGQYFFRWNNSVAGTGNTINAISTRLEDIRTLAGQTVTFSFWAKADASRALTVYAYQQSTGGSGTVTTTLGTATLTTSWARYTMTASLPSLSGVTIGTNSNLQIRVAMPTGTTMTCDFWGMQLEAGSVATPFQTATGTLAGELAACQRYYIQLANGNTMVLGNAFYYNTTEMDAVIHLPVAMRTTPTISQTSGTNYFTFLVNNTTDTFNSLTVGRTQSGNTALSVYNNTEMSGTAGQAGFISTNNASATFGLSAEL